MSDDDDDDSGNDGTYEDDDDHAFYYGDGSTHGGTGINIADANTRPLTKVIVKVVSRCCVLGPSQKADNLALQAVGNGGLRFRNGRQSDLHICKWVNSLRTLVNPRAIAEPLI